MLADSLILNMSIYLVQTIKKKECRKITTTIVTNNPTNSITYFCSQFYCTNTNDSYKMPENSPIVNTMGIVRTEFYCRRDRLSLTQSCQTFLVISAYIILKALLSIKATYPIIEPLARSSATAVHVDIVIIKEHKNIDNVI